MITGLVTLAGLLSFATTRILATTVTTVTTATPAIAALFTTLCGRRRG